MPQTRILLGVSINSRHARELQKAAAQYLFGGDEKFEAS